MQVADECYVVDGHAVVCSRLHRGGFPTVLAVLYVATIAVFVPLAMHTCQALGSWRALRISGSREFACALM